MIEATLADMRNSKDFFKTDSIIHIQDGRKKEDIGFFVPQSMHVAFQKFADEMARKKKSALLKRIKKAQDLDFLEWGVDDGL